MSNMKSFSKAICVPTFASYTSPEYEITYYKNGSPLMFHVNIKTDIWNLFLYSHKRIFTDVGGLQQLFPYT